LRISRNSADAFLAGGRVGREVHVLDHQVDRLARQHGQAFLGRGRVQRRDVVQREQHVEGDADGGVVVDDQYGRHGHRPLARHRHQTLRVAVAGEMLAARQAGP
jgi:hypothetical protein